MFSLAAVFAGVALIQSLPASIVYQLQAIAEVEDLDGVRYVFCEEFFSRLNLVLIRRVVSGGVKPCVGDACLLHEFVYLVRLLSLEIEFRGLGSVGAILESNRVLLMLCALVHLNLLSVFYVCLICIGMLYRRLGAFSLLERHSAGHRLGLLYLLLLLRLLRGLYNLRLNHLRESRGEPLLLDLVVLLFHVSGKMLSTDERTEGTSAHFVSVRVAGLLEARRTFMCFKMAVQLSLRGVLAVRMHGAAKYSCLDHAKILCTISGVFYIII